MGLDTTHDAWHGPYSAFSRWRTSLMRAAQWPVERVQDRDGFSWDASPVINWDAITEANILGDWDRLPEDPLVVLIAHSDCEGTLPVDALIPLAERLEGLADWMTPEQGQKPPDWNDGAPLPPRATYDGERAATLRFAAGCRAAAAVGEPVEFH